jgi:hypothetical protein
MHSRVVEALVTIAHFSKLYAEELYAEETKWPRRGGDAPEPLIERHRAARDIRNESNISGWGDHGQF